MDTCQLNKERPRPASSLCNCKAKLKSPIFLFPEAYLHRHRLNVLPNAVPPAAGMWPRVIREPRYDELGNLLIEGIDDNDRAWHEAVTGRSQEAWLLKQLYVERRFGRRNKRYSPKKNR